MTAVRLDVTVSDWPELAEVVRALPPGARIALADGCGSPRPAHAALSALARERGDLRLVTGWLPDAEHLDPTAFAEVRTYLPGWGLRAGADAGHVRHVPARLSAFPGLLAGPLRPDLLVAGLTPGAVPGSEVSWMGGLVRAGVPVAAVLDAALPRAAAGPAVPTERLTVVGERTDGPVLMPSGTPSPEHAAIGRHVADVVAGLDPPGGTVRLQWGLGKLGLAVVEGVIEAGVGVRVDSGLLGDPVVDLDEAGLLVGEPVATYLVGTRRLYDWAQDRARQGRSVLYGVEHTHDPGRLAADPPLVAVNTAVEIDVDGQVNAEGTAGSLVGGVGGHPDYAAAASRAAHGLSIVAVPAGHRGRPTLVERLSRPVATAAHDVDVVVTEHGAVDLRGCDREERRAALAELWART